jgi:hypothetical protein
MRFGWEEIHWPGVVIGQSVFSAEEAAPDAFAGKEGMQFADWLSEVRGIASHSQLSSKSR